MNLIIDQIPERGRQIVLDTTTEWAMAAVSDTLGVLAESLSGKLQISSKAGRVSVSGELNTSATCECERCGESFRLALPVEVELLFDPAPSGAPVEEEEEVDEEELDIGWYQGNSLNLADVVTEAVALALPIRLECPDTEECDKRTAKLLAEKGRSGDSSHPGFAALSKLR